VGEYRATALLVVGDEDHPDTLVRQLREAGVDAVTADVDGALARLGCREIDVLVASILVCPSPAELVEEALRREPGIEIVIAAARDAFEQALRCLRAGASDAISSPIEGDGLLTAINRALDRCRARGLARELLEAARLAGLGQLTGSIAHEIANSLAILNSSLDVLSQCCATFAELRSVAPQLAGPIEAWWARSGRHALDQADEVMGEAREGVQRLKLLARDLREMGLCDPSLLGEVEIGQAIEAALRVARAELTTRVKVALDLPPRLVVRANRGSLTQAFVQVFVRAAQAVRAAGVRRGNVRVRVRERDGMALIEIEDDIPASAEPAARHLAPYLPSGMPAGVGALGLAVARDLVQRQGGMLTARVRQDGGTVLELQMQAASGASQAVVR
jgi:signal transduction histidine kinase